MRKSVVVSVLCLVVSSFLMSGCAGKYSDVKKVNAEFADMTEAYVVALDKADNAKDAAKAMNRYADGFEKIWPRMQKLSEKYPELKDKSAVPDALRESQQRSEEAGKKIVGTFMKIMPYMDDPEVMKAQKRMATVMMGK